MGEQFSDRVIRKIRDISHSFAIKAQALGNEGLTLGSFEDEEEEIESYKKKEKMGDRLWGVREKAMWKWIPTGTTKRESIKEVEPRGKGN